MKSGLDLVEWPELTAWLGRFCVSALGRQRAERLRPCTEEAAHKALAEAVVEADGWIERGGVHWLAGLEDLGPVLVAASRSGSGLTALEFDPIRRSVRSIEQARRAVRDDDPVHRLRAMLRRLPDLSRLHERLERTFGGRGEVLSDASPELAEVRRAIDALSDEIRLLATKVIDTPAYRSVLRDGPPVLRDGRYMLAVRAESRGNVPGIVHDHSSSGATVFVEPRELVEPQNRLAQLRGKEARIVRGILLERTREVLRHEGELTEALAVLGRVDLIFARARFGRCTGGVSVPVRWDRTGLCVQRAYHPLLLQRVLPRSEGGDRRSSREELEGIRGDVVPFDLELGESYDALVITGPNTGGKTVTLKAVGLLAAMALAAIPAPVASGGWVGGYTRIEADIGDEQDLQQSLSTFSGHLRRIGALLRTADQRTLVLLDELGTGTDPKEGEALADALLRHLVSRGCTVVATTHLSGLKDLGYELERVENASLEFDVESLAPLYRLTIGLPGESNALLIAQRHGLPAAIVGAARERLKLHGAGDQSERAAAQVERSRRLVREKLAQAEQEFEAVETRRESLETSIRNLEEKEKGLEAQKEGEIDRVLQAARAEGLELLAALGTPPAGFKERVARVRAFVETLPERSDLTQRRTRFVETLRRDDTVYLPRYRETCRVRKVDRAKQLVTVLYRSLPLDVPFSDVACPDDFSDGVRG